MTPSSKASQGYASARYLHGARPQRLWLPLSPLFLLLAPVPILAIPVLYLARPLRGMNYAAAVFAIGRLLFALRGLEVDINTPAAVVRLKIL
jgi:hypothetical protein